MSTEEIYISDVHQLLEIIEELKKEYPVGAAGNSPAFKNFLFRGVSNCKYSLLPSVLRKHVQPFDCRTIENDLYKAWTTEERLLKEFRASACAYIRDLPPDSSLCRWAEYAQHFGVPTRFLDWTENPLVALFFACASSETDNAVLWILHQNNFNRFASKQSNAEKIEEKYRTLEELVNALISGTSDMEYPIVYTPFYVDNRMSVQSSKFMVWGAKPISLEELIPNERHMTYAPMPKGIRCFGDAQFKDILLKIHINAYSKKALIRSLDMMEVNEKSLFPGLDGIGRYIERKYRFNYEEAIEYF